MFSFILFYEINFFKKRYIVKENEVYIVRDLLLPFSFVIGLEQLIHCQFWRSEVHGFHWANITAMVRLYSGGYLYSLGPFIIEVIFVAFPINKYIHTHIRAYKHACTYVYVCLYICVISTVQ